MKDLEIINNSKQFKTDRQGESHSKLLFELMDILVGITQDSRC